MNKVFQKFSIIIPILNESKNLEKLTIEISKYLKKISYEIIFIDDNSSDNTSSLIKKIQKHNKRVKYYLRKNNPDLSLSCILGFQKASFKNIVVMDGDLQHDPKYLIRMIKFYKKETFICKSCCHYVPSAPIFKALITMTKNYNFLGLEAFLV